MNESFRTFFLFLTFYQKIELVTCPFTSIRRYKFKRWSVIPGSLFQQRIGLVFLTSLTSPSLQLCLRFLIDAYNIMESFYRKLLILKPSFTSSGSFTIPTHKINENIFFFCRMNNNI